MWRKYEEIAEVLFPIIPAASIMDAPQILQFTLLVLSLRIKCISSALLWLQKPLCFFDLQAYVDLTLILFVYLKRTNAFHLLFSSGAVYDHSSSHHGPLLSARCLLCLCLLGHCLFGLHHPGGYVRPQGKSRGLSSSHHLLPADYSSNLSVTLKLPFIRAVIWAGMIYYIMSCRLVLYYWASINTSPSLQQSALLYNHVGVCLCAFVHSLHRDTMETRLVVKYSSASHAILWLTAGQYYVCINI